MRKRLPHRVAVQTFSVTTSATGDRSGKTWATSSTVWAHMKPLSGFKGDIAGRDVSQVSHVCDMYYNEDTALNAKDRLLMDSENYAIQWVEEVNGRTHEVRVFCRRVDP